MENIPYTPYIDRPLPPISLRTEWRLFESRPLPRLTARMGRDELLEMVGEEASMEEPTQDNNTLGQPLAPPVSVPLMGGSSGDSLWTAAGSKTPNKRSRKADNFEETGRTNRSADKYRKPRGEPNRPNSGGYSLERHLIDECGWTIEQFQEVQQEVHKLAAQKLARDTGYKDQQEHAVRLICDEVKKSHPIARGFDKSWVIKDMLKMHLKNKTERLKKEEMRAFYATRNQQKNIPAHD
ncbi:hypothetical protein DFH09DRAFT_1309011 [Mycena vulgaris]|nr:hypothetical protein DFH09DRAFT_1309011 [Mycena vulgaris]